MFTARSARAGDVDFVMGLFALPHVRRFLLGPPSAARWLDIFAQVDARDDHWLVIIERDGTPIGHANLSLFDGWYMEIRAIAFVQQRTGAGRFTMDWLIHRGFKELGAHRIYLSVAQSNAAARALYESVGFQCEGCYRDGFRSATGEFENLLPYGLLEPSAAS